jgi:SMC interacting uncharacterized protein involved in chromosome segregation
MKRSACSNEIGRMREGKKGQDWVIYLDFHTFDKNSIMDENNDTPESLIAQKAQLWSEIGAAKSEFNDLREHIEALKLESTVVETGVEQLNTRRNELNEELAGMTGEVTNLRNERESLINARSQLSLEIERLHETIRILKTRHDLFSNDIAGIGEDNKAQRVKYFVGIVITSVLVVWLVRGLITMVFDNWSMPLTIHTYFSHEPLLLFLLLIMSRVSLIACFFILIYIFLNLLKAFVSQYIRTQDKMTGVRILDFLVSKIKSQQTFGNTATDLEIQNAILEKQNSILSEHIPKLIDSKTSSFEKSEKSKSIKLMERMMEKLIEKK